MVSFLDYLVFFEAVFCTQQVEMICRMDFDMFFGILIFDPRWWFCKGYRLCMMADFQNGLISRIFSVFGAVFSTQQLEMICRMDFDMFFGILIFDPKWWFCKGFPWWPIFKMVSFLDYLVFLERFLAHNNPKCFVELILRCFLEF